MSSTWRGAKIAEKRLQDAFQLEFVNFHGQLQDNTFMKDEGHISDKLSYCLSLTPEDLTHALAKDFTGLPNNGCISGEQERRKSWNNEGLALERQKDIEDMRSLHGKLTILGSFRSQANLRCPHLPPVKSPQPSSQRRPLQEA